MHWIADYWSPITVGALKDLGLTVFAVFASFVLGILGAAGRLYGPRALKFVITWYVEIIRGLPAILQLFILFFGLPQVGIKFSPLEAAVIWLVAYGTGYAIEIFRAGIIDVKQGQREAAAALGLGRFVTLRKVIVPQAFAVMMPPITSFVVLQLKNTTLLYLVGFGDAMYEANLGTSSTSSPGVMYLMAAVAYLIMSLGIGWIGRVLEKRTASYR